MTFVPEALIKREEELAALELRLMDEKKALVAYLEAKIKAEDFHAVADAAMDLREINSKLSILLLF